MKCINRTAPYVGVLSAAALFIFAASTRTSDAVERDRNVVSPAMNSVRTEVPDAVRPNCRSTNVLSCASIVPSAERQAA